MKIVLLTALGVGGATIFGSLIGFVFRNISHKFSDIVLSFAAGVMLSAAISQLWRNPWDPRFHHRDLYWGGVPESH